MCDTEVNKRICISYNFFHCRQPHQDMHLQEKGKSIIVYNFKKIFS